MNWMEMAGRVVAGEDATREELLAVMSSGDDELLSVLNAAFYVRHHFHGREVRVHVLQNAKSGLCPEDCKFCSQSIHFNSDIDRYNMQGVDELVQGAHEALAKGAVTYCMVTSTRGPTKREVATVAEAARRIKSETPLHICASLGLLKPGQAEQLKAAGVDRYNHNIETSEDFFPKVASTHQWRDRVGTVLEAKAAGLEACCGGIMGLGESIEDRVDLAIALRDIGVESVPVNFMDPRPGTPLGDVERPKPNDCLRALAMFRFAHPRADVRVAGGREVSLGAMQPLALYAANSFFTDGYLTTPGAEPHQDWKMIEEAGFVGAAAK
ncbi:MAG: biotin synthase BioB [Myxococcota bacterium]